MTPEIAPLAPINGTLGAPVITPKTKAERYPAEEVEEDVADVAHRIFDIVAEDPEGEQVAEKVQEVRVEEHIGEQPHRQRLVAIGRRQRPVRRTAGPVGRRSRCQRHPEKDEDVGCDQRPVDPRPGDPYDRVAVAEDDHLQCRRSLSPFGSVTDSDGGGLGQAQTAGGGQPSRVRTRAPLIHGSQETDGRRDEAKSRRRAGPPTGAAHAVRYAELDRTEAEKAAAEVERMRAEIASRAAEEGRSRPVSLRAHRPE